MGIADLRFRIAEFYAAGNESGDFTAETLSTRSRLMLLTKLLLRELRVRSNSLRTGLRCKSLFLCALSVSAVNNLFLRELRALRGKNSLPCALCG
jgi:hypothetical protein